MIRAKYPLVAGAHRVSTLAADPFGPEVHSRISNVVHKGVILYLVTFLLIFPKGGLKIAGIPVTWGYLGLGFLFVLFSLTLRVGWSVPLKRVRLLALALLVPFQAVSWLALLGNGVENLGFTISFVVTFFFLPAMFLLVLGVYLDRVDLRFLLRLLRFGVLAVAVYGIFLFVYKLMTGSFIEIPYLTVNAGDLGALEDKYIDRGGVFKLISTYNNGNIYGISILMLLPLYAWLEPSVVRNSVVKLSLLLTLSRTVWAGLIFYELVQRFYVKRVSVRTLFLLLLSLMLVALGVWYALDLMKLDVSFLLDRKLGGRIGQWRELENTTVLPSVVFAGIAEIVYLSVLQNFGLVGLSLFLLGIAAPLVLHGMGALPFSATGYKKSIAAGLLIYLFVSMSDGAILYIPVMAIYWFLVSMLLSDNPSFADSARIPKAGPAPDQRRREPSPV